MLRLSGAIQRRSQGKFPNLSVNSDGVVVEVHQPSAVSGNIYCQVGQINGDKVDFREESEVGIGKFPKVAIYNDYVVKVHEGKYLRRIYYDFGSLDDKLCIRWKTQISNSPIIGMGRLPAVAIHGNRAVITYDSAYIGWSTYYQIGTIDEQGESIIWGDKNNLFEAGVTETSVALNQEYIVSAGRGWTKIRYLIGRINENGAHIEKLLEVEYDYKGYCPSLCMDNEGCVIMMWQAAKRQLSYVNGEVITLQNSPQAEHSPPYARINWGDTRNHVFGYNPVLALSANNNHVVEEHETSFPLSSVLFYCTGALQKQPVPESAINRDNEGEPDAEGVEEDGRSADENEDVPHTHPLDSARVPHEECNINGGERAVYLNQQVDT